MLCNMSYHERYADAEEDEEEDVEKDAEEVKEIFEHTVSVVECF